MPRTLLTDEEFIRAWRELRSPLRIAREYNMDERNIRRRRRQIEKDFGIELKASGEIIEQERLKHPERVHVDLDEGTVVIFSDAHFWPGIRSTAFRALIKIIAELKPAIVIANGDIFDGARISRHARRGWSNLPSVKEELDTCIERMTEIEDVCPPGCKLYWPLGNHDARYEDFLVRQATDYEGIKSFQLRDHFPKWTPCWSVWINETLVVKHRLKSGIHATHNNTLWSGKSTATGHLHSGKVTPFADYNGNRYGIDTGTLAALYGPQFDYAEDNPQNWRSGFAVCTFIDRHLLFPELAIVTGHNRVEFRGAFIELTPED